MSGTVVAVMNAKGGVGKSTTSVMLAEALSSQHKKKVLVVDTDPQANSSLMLLGEERLEEVHDNQKRTLSGLIDAVATGPDVAVQTFITKHASDVSNARTVDLIAGSVELAWQERDMHDQGEKTPVVVAAQRIAALRSDYDFIIIDCPPSISLFTECWLQHSELQLIPARPDLLSNVGLRLVNEIRNKNMKVGRHLADNIGVLITIVRGTSNSDKRWVGIMQKDPKLKCFDTVIPQTDALLRIVEMSAAERRNFSTKYGAASKYATEMTREFLGRHEAWRAARGC